MNKGKVQLLSPLFLKYQSDFEKNPRSRVFAPLAETYRKLGMTDKAMEILSQGIRFHPTYVLGYLGLAFCYFDLKQFNLAYTTLRPLIENNRDNLRLQKLFADVCLELGKDEEALETFKYLLFINPRDKEVGDQVAKLERKIEERYRPNHKPIIIPEKELSSPSEMPSEDSLFNVDKLSAERKSEKNDFDDWMTVDLSHDAKTSPKETASATETSSSSKDYDQWNVKKSDEVHEASPKKMTPPKPEIERAYEVHLDLDNDFEFDEEPAEMVHQEREEGAPLVTHTLVDLYCGQGHIEKALEVLEKILLLNPNDQKTIKKIKEIQALAQPLEQYAEIQESSPREVLEQPRPKIEPLSQSLVDLNELEETTEEDGRRHLMSLIDEKIGPIEIEEEDAQATTVRQVEEKLSMFLKKIQKRALDYQGRV